MDVLLFVQNLKSILDSRKISYTRAGRESGAGEEFIRNMERKGSAPSVEKVQQMADYLGVTTSELLGEKKEPGAIPGPQPDILEKFNALSPDDKDEVRAIIEWKLAKKNKAP